MVKSKGPPYLNAPPEPYIYIQNAWGIGATTDREFDIDEFTGPWTRAIFEKDFHPFRDSRNVNVGAVEVIFYRRNVSSDFQVSIRNLCKKI